MAGRRAILSRGWGELGTIDEAQDCIAIGCELGLGTSVPMGELTAARLASALQAASEPAIVERANSVAAQLVVDGAAVAARSLIALGS